jgi:hypothetical protein
MDVRKCLGVMAANVRPSENVTSQDRDALELRARVWLRSWRNVESLTREQVAQRYRCSVGAIRNYECGANQIPAWPIVALIQPIILVASRLPNSPVPGWLIPASERKAA